MALSASESSDAKAPRVPLARDAFLADPRLIEARRLMLEALADHQQTLTGVCPPQAERVEEYQKIVKQFGQVRGADLYYPYLGSGLGSGALVELADGSVKYDMISGIGVHYFGHGARAVVSASIDAALSDVVMQGNLQQDREAADVSSLLLGHATASGAPLAHCLLTSSGAMANENALKIAFQTKHPAQRILAFEHGFAGRTLALASVTDKAAYRVGLPNVLDVDLVPFFEPSHPGESIARSVAVLRHHLDRFPKQHAAIVVECVQGEGGYHVGNREFFLALFAELRDHDVAILFDEVQTFGRTSRLFAFQHFGLDEFADIVTLGKLSQFCATLFRAEFKPRPGLISQTFTSGTAALFAGRAVIRSLIEENFFGPEGKISVVHGWFRQRLERIGGDHPGWISGPFGLGAMIAFTPFDGSADIVNRLLRALFDNGVIAFIAGSSPARVRFLPPIGVVTEADIDNVCGILEKTMAQVR